MKGDHVGGWMSLGGGSGVLWGGDRVEGLMVIMVISLVVVVLYRLEVWWLLCGC